MTGNRSRLRLLGNSLAMPFACLFLLIAGIPSVLPADELTVKQNEEEVKLLGKIVAEAEDLSVLFRSNDGRLTIYQPEQIIQAKRLEKPVPSISKKKLSAQLLKELPPGFRIYDTKHFVVAFQTEKAYARWVGGIYERLLKGFEKFWVKKKKFKLDDPEHPLVIVVFGSRQAYAQYVQRELGSEPGTMVAYYNLMTNRVAMYDLTVDIRSANDRNRKVNEILANPNALPMVATVVHEGVHQLMFNCGMQTRFSDTPLWINEGMAMYFETPDMDSSSGWRGIGKVNFLRLNRFRSDLANRPADSLKNMISQDAHFSDPKTATAAYAEAWAFNYFLLNKFSDEYVAYLKFMSEKKPLDYDTPEKRVTEFQQFFPQGFNALDREFVAFIRELR